MDARRGVKRFRALSGRMAVDDEQRRNAKEARLEALETGVDEDAFVIDEDDEESDMDVDMEGRGRLKKKKFGAKRQGKASYSVPSASSFKVLLEESGVYEQKIAEPHYLSAEACMENISSRKFCCVCGNSSSYRCVRCREPFCSIRCQGTHQEIQCVKLTL